MAKRMPTLGRLSLGALLVGTLALAGSTVAAPRAGGSIKSVVPQTSSTTPGVRDTAELLPRLGYQMTDLVPVGGVQPYSHTLERADGVQPHTDTEEAPDLSRNWSGLVEMGSGATFTSVQGDWVVPGVKASSGDKASGTWIGIDGDKVSSLIQAGTAQNSGPDFGGTQYYAWVELLPGAPEIIGGPSGAAPVRPGDQMAASIFERSLGIWTIDLNDTTQSWSLSEQFPYVTPGDTAEWIEEAPQEKGATATLSDYGSTVFTQLGAAGTGASAASLYPFNMVSQSGTIISYPANLNTSSDSFSLFYGSPDLHTTMGPAPAPSPVASPSTASHGYWLAGSDGGVFAFGSAQFYGSTGSRRLQRPVVDITSTADRGGYWLAGSDGGIFAFGNAGFYGSIPGLGLHPEGSGLQDSLSSPIVGMVSSADGRGYLMVASDGGVFAFGDARFVGSCPGIGGCSGTAVAVVVDASGRGYWVVTQTGNVYTFGDAPYYGAPGPNTVPVTSAVGTPDGRGYWILLANGRVFSYGDAVSYVGAIVLTDTLDPASSIFTTSDGDGYWVAAADGAVAGYGNAPDQGSMVGLRLNGSIAAGTGW
jgi:hypothetical protein